MTLKRNLNEEINLDNILNELSNNFEATCNELQAMLREESQYKRLKRVGEEQFFDAVSESSMEIESQKTRLCFAKINLLAVEVDNAIDEIIKKKFEGKFFHTLREEVLKTILKLYSDQKNETELMPENDKVLLPAGDSEVKQKKDEKIVLEKLKDLSKYCAENLNDIKKQVIEMPIGDIEPIGKIEPTTTRNLKGSTVKEDKLGINEHNNFDDIENISFESVSSVHTSDLSSFDDEIVFSSDEETGIKEKRLSLKEAQEKVAELKTKRSKATKDENSQVKNITLEDSISLSENPGNESSEVPQKSLSQRIRKPNLKYMSDDILSPIKTSAEKILTSSAALEVDNALSKKRGRSRKYYP